MVSVAELRQWSERLVRELAQLPDTLERLRLGAADFQVVGQRLRATSTALEELTNLYTRTVSDSVRRSTDAAEQMRSQLERMPQLGITGETVAAAVSELQKTVRAMSSLRPWLGPADRPDREG
jgi:hypothetical protein